MNADPNPVPTRPAEHGFSLMEVTVSLLLLSFLLVAILMLFDSSNKLARVQTHVADMQQSLRVAQYQIVRNVRMAGRGGLPRGPVAAGIAVNVRDNVPASGANANIAVGDSSSPKVVEGSDVVTIRGVFNTPIYHINPPAAALTLSPDDVNPTSGTIKIDNPIINTAVAQDMQPLIDAVDAGLPEALLLVSPLGGTLYAVVQLDPSTSDTSDPDHVVLGFLISGGSNTVQYTALNPTNVFPAELRSVAYVGLLEEYRYYVREDFAIPGDTTSEPMPRLSEARFYPGTETAYKGDATELHMDIADNILDLQVAEGIDTNNDQVVSIKDLTPAADDEWLFNYADDDPTDTNTWDGAATGNSPQLAFLRITTLARTDRQDFDYVSEPITAIEDHSYNEPATPATNTERTSRRYRRQLLESIVDLRNI